MTTTQSGPSDPHALYDNISQNFRFENHGNLSASYVQAFAILTDGHDVVIYLNEEGDIQLGFELYIPRPNKILYKPSPYNFRRALEQGIYKGIVDAFPGISIKRQNKAISNIFKNKVLFNEYSFSSDAISVIPSFSAIYSTERDVIYLPCLVKFGNADTIAMPYCEDKTMISSIPHWEIPELEIAGPDENYDSINKIIFAMFMNNQITIPEKDNENLWEYP